MCVCVYTVCASMHNDAIWLQLCQLRVTATHGSNVAHITIKYSYSYSAALKQVQDADNMS